MFGNDGTLWREQPTYVQAALALDRVKMLAPKHPEWRDKQPFKAVLEGDHKAIAATGQKGLVEVVAATHTGMTVDEFDAAVNASLVWEARDTLFQSILGVDPVVTLTLLAGLPELGTATGRRLGALVGLAPFADDSRSRQGGRHIRGGRV